MIEFIRAWYERHFSDPQVVILAIFLTISFAIIVFLGDILAPVLVAIVFAYLLEGVVGAMERHAIPRVLAVFFVLLVFIVFCLVLFFGLAPLLSRQVTQLFRELPGMIAAGQQALLRLPELYPALFTESQIQDLIEAVRAQVGALGQSIVSVSLTQAVNLFGFAIYVILVPLLVFFALKDKDKLIAWVTNFLPRERQLSFRVWKEVDIKIANYVRGKFIEIMIIWVASYVTFALMGLNFSLLLSFLVGISVIIPFVGAIAVTIPVALIAFFQWDFSASFWYLLLAYQIIQILDGNVLVPLLFSEVVNLHPIAIIVAVLFFGGIWGVWGIFFAIPLATVVQAVLNAWPTVRDDPDAGSAEG
jgi:putative permease